MTQPAAEKPAAEEPPAEKPSAEAAPPPEGLPAEAAPAEAPRAEPAAAAQTVVVQEPAEVAEEASHRHEPHGRYLLTLAIGALGIVYGDIGTSPLYALRECFHGSHG